VYGLPQLQPWCDRGRELWHEYGGFGDVLGLRLGGDSVDTEWVEDRRLPRDGVYPGMADIERPSRACTAITLAAVAGALSTLGRR